MLQVRQAIAEALGIKKLSLVKLVKRLGSDRLMTSVGDSERLSQKSVSAPKKQKHMGVNPKMVGKPNNHGFSY